MLKFLHDLRPSTSGQTSNPDLIKNLAVPAANDAPTTIGRGVKLRGTVDAPSPVQVVGEVTGMIRAPAITIEQGARIEGTIAADVIICQGQVVDSDIFAKRLVLKSSAEVTGEICCSDLEIEEGALFEGKHRRHVNPLSQAPSIDDADEDADEDAD